MCTSLSAVALAKEGPRISLNGSHRRFFGSFAHVMTVIQRRSIEPFRWSDGRFIIQNSGFFFLLLTGYTTPNQSSSLHYS